ncbi:peptide ABC transporter substrate-binding protein [Nesterenkonia cremea]|uniref:Peptide ABC transporter DppA n=1 Tax=Nesterenkonia cremea TaxID=1882340 RepID=A0A917ENU4_9MICC|nr:ABC transporter substrate-binding protein [Nesterenkonia cremea]GGE64257.1 putative peptide ABC transporter DppA [Nesterenkonia cremea]
MAEKKTWRSTAVAITAVGAIGLTACGDGGGNGNGAEGGGAISESHLIQGGADPSGVADDVAEQAVEGGGTVSIFNTEPQYLMPGNSSEVGGSKVLEQLFTGLTVVDYETFEAGPGVAESWDSDDQVTWTFELGEDWTFHNGDPVTAETFVDTFNWVVDPDNAQQNADFYDVILGYQDVVDGDAEELEGVRALDDHTLEIELNEPFSALPLMLSYTGFYPLPDEAFEDPDAFEQAPIGNGRYQMDGEWEHDVEIAMERYEDWPGEEPGIPERIEWRMYSDPDTAYMDVQSGELDVLDQIPPNRLPTVEDDFADHFTGFETSSSEYIGFPLYQEEFEDPDVRQALSMAVDREAITETIFDGARQPAESVIPPMLIEDHEGTCEYCQHNPEEAAELYEAAGGPDELTVYFNSDGGHDDWVEAVSNMWQETLGIEDVTFESLEFAQYLELHDNQEISGPYRMGWVLSYPSPQYAMEPVYTTGQSSNYADYSSEEFDELIAEANAADPEEADDLYIEAEEVLLEDMPIMPLWFRIDVSVHSENIHNESIYVDPRTFLRAEQLVVLED